MSRTLAALPLFCLLAACAPDGHAPDSAPAAEEAPAPHAAAAAPEPEVVMPAAEGATMLVPGQVLEIALEGNASTGYAWEIVEDGGPRLALQPVPPRPEEQAQEPRMVGAPGIYRWRFEAVKPGQARIRLVYRRPWEEGVDPLQEVVFDVVVQAR